MEGEQYSVFERVLIGLEDAPNKCTLIHPKQERIETNGDGVKMFNSDECVRVEHLRPHAPSEMWTPALPRPRWFHHVPV